MEGTISDVSIADFCSKIHRNESTSLSAELESISRLTKEKTGAYVLEDGGSSLVTRAWLCEYAEEKIDIQYFIFSTDNIGLIACDYLVRAADRGVKVRILIDDIMVDAGVEDVLTLDSHENIEIKIYNPGISFGKNILSKIKQVVTNFRGINQRMHNKTFIVDDKVVITGGRNIADEYFDYDHEYNFRDRDVLLLGKVVPNVQSSFDQFWDNEISIPVRNLTTFDDSINSNKQFVKLHNYACDTNNFWPQIREQIEHLPETFEKVKQSNKLLWLDDVHFISDNPGKNDGTKGLYGGGITTDTLIQLVRNAKKTIDIQSPYLITTESSRNLFRDAINRGVKIRVLTNSLASTDNLEAFSGYQRDREKLLKTGVRIFEFRPDAMVRYKMLTGDLQKELDFTPIFGLHAKTMVIDGNITAIGTFNLDPRSTNLNTECFVVLRSEEVATNVLTGIEEEFKSKNSWETTLEFNPDIKAGKKKQIKSWTRKIVPKGVL